MLRITNDSGEFEVEVLLLSEARGPAVRRANALSRNRREPRVAPEGCGGTQGDDAVRTVAARAPVEAGPRKDYPVSRAGMTAGIFVVRSVVVGGLAH